MFEERHERLLEDAFAFKELVGGADRLSEVGWRPEEIMTTDYMEEIQDLLIEWLPEESENLSIMKIDDCLKAEKLLSNFFKDEILEIMNR